MFPLSPTAWLSIGAAVLIAALGIALKVQTGRLDAAKAEYAAFKVKVEILGEQAEKAAKTRELEDLATKKRADDENAKKKRDLAGVYDAY